ncbi:MAG: hypothetical protein ACI4TK_04510 [Agathobacter sp.]
MINIDDYLFKYGLHDCVVDRVLVQNNSLVFCFKTGVYKLNESAKETTKTSYCLMDIEIRELNIEKMWEHIEVIKICKNTVCEVVCEEFIDEVNKFKFDIQENYLSSFGQSILLEGYTLKSRYQIKISEIINIRFSFK